jgi:hypothetical protein
MNPRVPLESHAPLGAGWGVYRVGEKYLTDLDRALRWGIILERPVERLEKGEFRVLLPRIAPSGRRGEGE